MNSFNGITVNRGTAVCDINVDISYTSDITFLGTQSRHSGSTIVDTNKDNLILWFKDSTPNDITSVSWATSTGSITAMEGDATILTYTLPGHTITPAGAASLAAFPITGLGALSSITVPKNYWKNKKLHFDNVNGPTTLTLPDLSSLAVGSYTLEVDIQAANDATILDKFTLTIVIADCSTIVATPTTGTSTTINHAYADFIPQSDYSEIFESPFPVQCPITDITCDDSSGSITWCSMSSFSTGADTLWNLHNSGSGFFWSFYIDNLTTLAATVSPGSYSFNIVITFNGDPAATDVIPITINLLGACDSTVISIDPFPD